MNNKDILKKIRREANKIEPNLSVFIHERFSNSPPKKKRTWWAFLSSATFVLSVLVLGLLLGNFSSISISSSNQSSSNPSTPSTSIIPSEPPISEISLPPLRLEGDKAALSISTIATATLFNSLSITNPLQTKRSISFSPNRPTFDFNETMNLIQPYLGMFEQLLGRSEAPLIITEPLNDSPFAYVDRFEVVDIQGTPVSYELFYNLENVTEINEELFYDFSGELRINNGLPFNVLGQKVMEEDERVLSFKAELDSTNYIESFYKFEEDETKIRIRKMTDGILNISMFKLEVDDEETEIELFFLQENDESRIRDRFKFQYETDENETILKISFSVMTQAGIERGKIKVRVVEILDANNVIIGYEYLAYNLDENDEETDEWRDRRDHPNEGEVDDNEDDEENDDDDD